jgi:hypothetical protein
VAENIQCPTLVCEAEHDQSFWGQRERWLRYGDLRKRGTSDLRYGEPPDDLIVMLSLLIMAESTAKASAPSSTTQPAAAALLRAILFALFAAL